MSNQVMAGRSDIEKEKVDESASGVVEHGGAITDEEWTSTFRAKLCSDSPLPASCCIFRVPEVLQRGKKEAYEPNMVSIGPFHRDGAQFQLVEKVKGWYLQRFLIRLNIRLDSLIDRIKKLEKDARACYSEPFMHLDQNKFVEMLILDGCFLIELFRKAVYDGPDVDDPIFNLPCMLEYLYHDLMLLENQLPWFVLKNLYSLIEDRKRDHRHCRDFSDDDRPLSVLVIDFFRESVADACIFSYPDESNSCNEIVHILDLIRTALVLNLKQRDHGIMMTSTNLPRRIPSAVTLSDVGVKFKKRLPAATGGIMDINFSSNDKIFSIPAFGIDSRSGPLFRNLIAYEHFYHRCMHKITSYTILMDSLLGSIKDVDFLCEQGILMNKLSAEDASQFFKQLYNFDTTLIQFHYADLCEDVNDYCVKQRRRLIPTAQRNKWIQQFQQDYLDTPWKFSSFVGAVILVLLTFLQTTYTLLQYYH